MSEPNDRDLDVAWSLYNQVQDDGQEGRIQEIVATYREETEKAERERVCSTLHLILEYAEEQESAEDLLSMAKEGLKAIARLRAE